MGEWPRAVCMGGNGRFYMATQGEEIVCYDDWDIEAWRVPLSGNSSMLDMIMGGDDTVYVLYSTRLEDVRSIHWASFDPTDGSAIVDMDIEVPHQFIGALSGELAIGEGGKLIYLNSDGYLAVFSSLMQFRPPDHSYTPGGLGG